MSNAETPRSQESHQATRQILDELDALMDRMMSLPVQDADDPRLDPLPSVSQQYSPHVAVESPPASESAETRTLSDEKQENNNPAPNPPTSYNIPEEDEQPKIKLPAYVTDDASPSPMEKLPPISPIPKFEPPDRNEEPVATAGWHPLLRMNELFDRSTRWMGPLGILLRGKWGRGLLGITGLALLAWAAVWGYQLWWQ